MAAHIGIVGNGKGFGGAIKTHLERLGLKVMLRNPRNSFVDLDGCGVLVLAFPAEAYRDVVPHMRAHLSWSPVQSRLLIGVTKGIAWDCLPSDCLAKELSKGTYEYAHLAGPAYAKDLLDGNIIREVVAAESSYVIDRVRAIFGSSTFKTYSSRDLRGVQAAAVYRSIGSAALGAVYDLSMSRPELSGSAYGSIFSRLVAEHGRFVVYLGGSPGTVLGQAGLADLVMCGNADTGEKSRNWQFGRLLAQGMSADSALKKINSTVEVYNTLRALEQGMRVFTQIDLPYAHALYRVVYGHATVDKLYEEMLGRKPGDELA